MKKLILASTVLTLVLTSTVKAQDDAAATDNPLHELDYFVGSWIWEGEINRHGEAPEAFRWRHDCERTLDGRFILEKQRDLSAGLKMMHLSLTGWDDEDEKIRAWGFWAPPGGPYEEVVYTKTNNGWHITREGLDGMVTILNNDAWKYAADFERDGAMNQWGFTARRLKSPTEDHAKKAIDTLVGHWALTFEEDGEKKTAKVTATPSSSKMALRVTYQEPGEQPANGMFAWHETKKQIVETWFRGGEHVRICFDGMTDDGALIGPSEGMLDGEIFAGIRILKFHSPNHYTLTIRGTTSEGEPLPEVTFVAKRIVSKPVE